MKILVNSFRIITSQQEEPTSKFLTGGLFLEPVWISRLIKTNISCEFSWPRCGLKIGSSAISVSQCKREIHTFAFCLRGETRGPDLDTEICHIRPCERLYGNDASLKICSEQSAAVYAACAAIWYQLGTLCKARCLCQWSVNREWSWLVCVGSNSFRAVCNRSHRQRALASNSWITRPPGCVVEEARAALLLFF